MAPPTRYAPDIPSVGTSPTPARSCRSSGAIRVRPGPPSCSGALGDNVSVECRFEAPSDATVTWLQVCPRGYRDDSWNCSWPEAVLAAGGGRQVLPGRGVSTLSFPQLQHNHSGLYFCRVQSGKAIAQSCGTFVRVEGEWGALGGPGGFRGSG